MDKQRLYWQCRRGMKELDVLLDSYLSHCFDKLSNEEQSAFVELLKCSDQELYQWFLGVSQSDKKTLQAIVEKIRDYQHTQH